jgi:hypothetical protein
MEISPIFFACNNITILFIQSDKLYEDAVGHHNTGMISKPYLLKVSQTTTKIHCRRRIAVLMVDHSSTLLVDCNISAKAFSESKSSGDKGEQKFEEGCMCKP